MNNPPRKDLLLMYETMLKIRTFETEIANRWPEQEMKSPPHFYSGQEAIATGVCLSLRKGDQVVGFYRGHGYFLATGGDPNKFIAEMYCRVTGSNEGKGGSMLISSPESGYVGSSAIVGGGIPIAAGIAFGNKLQKKKSVVICFIGDAATEEGVFYETMNFIALHKLPIVFDCENNSYAVTTHIKFRQAVPSQISSHARAFGIKIAKIDGNDVLKVNKIAEEAIAQARKGKGPTFIEASTFRLHVHVGEKLDWETGLRTREEFDSWVKKDPIKRMEKYLLKNKIATKNELLKIKTKIDILVAKAFTFAKKSPLPTKDDLMKNVYA